MDRQLFVVVPTFKELSFVEGFFASWRQVSSVACTLVVCNANAVDETSAMIESLDSDYPHSVVELAGHAGLYWSGLVELGLQYVVKSAAPCDLCLLTNIDVGFQNDPIRPLVEANNENPSSQLSALALNSKGRLLSAGIQVKSWCFSLNKHLFEGCRLDEIDRDSLVSATYLPTRFFAFPVRAIKVAGFPNSRRLPHYAADYEYTNRLRLAGFQPYVHTGTVVLNVEKNTGFKSFEKETAFGQRVRNLFNLKCTYHLPTRFWFVWLTYPPLSRLPGLISSMAKILVEVIIGGHRLGR